MSKHEGKTAIVTGGASGIGRALAERLAALGAHVVVADIQAGKAAEAVSAIRSKGGSAESVTLDVTDAAAFQRVADETAAKHKKIDYLFNNAGIATVGELRDFSILDWNRIIDINIRGVVHGIHAVYGHMIRQGSGHIVNTASVAGLVPQPGFAAYCATKHAVVGLSTSMRYEAQAHGVRVSALCPGLVNTPIIDEANFRNMQPDARNMERVKRFAVSPEVCAQKAVEGMERNDAVIVVTGHGKAMVFVSRYLTPLADILGRQSAKELRKMRSEGQPIA